MMNNNRTIEYYNENARRFVEDTANVKFHHMQNRFLNKLPKTICGEVGKKWST